jgi:hypothetical protein
MSHNEQGWGRVNLSQVIQPPSSIQVNFIDDSSGLQTGKSHEYSVLITDSTSLFKATLVYSDYPGKVDEDEDNESRNIETNKLVNNLNLQVYSPGGKYFLGNDFSQNNTSDTTNNVEGVIIESPEKGKWTIKVIGSDVPESPQNYALVISGSFEDFTRIGG